MKSCTTAPNYKGFRFPPEIISHAVWLYFRFSLSFRDVEELLVQRTRLREKKMRRFKSTKHAQRFLSAFGPISGHFQPRRHRLKAEEYRAILQGRFQQWNEITGVK
jgi:transposase-like protein